MVRVLLRVGILAAMLSVLTYFYVAYRHTTYSINHGANAFDVFLWRLTGPGEYLTASILPHEYTDMCCYDPQILARSVWLLPTLDLTFNALVWSAVASGVAYIILRARKPRRLPTI
jgi:hypothetical protein